MYICFLSFSSSTWLVGWSILPPLAVVNIILILLYSNPPRPNLNYATVESQACTCNMISSPWLLVGRCWWVVEYTNGIHKNNFKSWCGTKATLWCYVLSLAQAMDGTPQCLHCLQVEKVNPASCLNNIAAGSKEWCLVAWWLTHLQIIYQERTRNKATLTPYENRLIVCLL